MIESYQLEIIRKRRAARFFWLIVFVCSFFLYYFFQGYYPDVRLGMHRIFSESGSESGSGSSDLIRSFGIINVKTTPLNATILLGSGAYGNNEKKMSDYGQYTMTITASGFLTNHSTFRIDREKPFFIEKISLLPQPLYRELKDIQKIYQVSPDSYIMRSLSGNLIYSGGTIRGSINYSGALEHIGGSYFVGGGRIWNWESTLLTRATPEIENYVDTCPELEWQDGIFSCPQANSILTPSGKYMTGVLALRGGLIEQSGSLSQIVSGNIVRAASLTGIVDISEISLINNLVYRISSGSLIPEQMRESTIDTSLDTITSAISLDDDIVVIGTIEEQPQLLIRRIGDPIDRDRLIRLPSNLSYTDVVFHMVDGNMIIETSGGLLLVYRGSEELIWMVEGDILTYSKNGAAYRKDGKIWWVDWSEKI